MSTTDEILKTIEQYGISGKGKKEMVKHLYGDRLTIREMAVAKCYDCMGYYSDGRGVDCEIPTCPLYPVMPYRIGEKYVSKIMSSEQRKKSGDRMRALHAK